MSQLLSLSTMDRWWAISSWLPTYAHERARAEGAATLAYWGSAAGLLHAGGGIVGDTIPGFLAGAIGQRGYLVLMLAGSLLLTPVTYLWVHLLAGFAVLVPVIGFFTLVQCSWFAVYLPEPFTSSVRSTAMSFVFNASRLIAWVEPLTAGAFDPVLRGNVAVGFVSVLGLVVAPLMPDTRGYPLPRVRGNA